MESNSKGEFKSKRIEFVPKEVEIVRGLIKDSYRKILAHDFYEGCGEKNCKWCNFVKYNVMVDSFVDLEGEELDD